jgi:hypothetical protein
MIKEKISDETLVKGIAIILLLMIGKNQNRIAKGITNKILFLFGVNNSFNGVNNSFNGVNNSFDGVDNFLDILILN